VQERNYALNSNKESQLDNRVSFEWLGKSYSYSERQLHTLLNLYEPSEMPEDVLKINKWYITHVGQFISPSWLFQMITGEKKEDVSITIACNKLSKMGLQIFYQANQRDKERGAIYEVADGDFIEKKPPYIRYSRKIWRDTKYFLKTFSQYISPDLTGGEIVFPETQNSREVSYNLPKIGTAHLRQNLKDFWEFSFDPLPEYQISSSVQKKIKDLLAEDQNLRDYPIYCTRSGEKGFRIATNSLNFSLLRLKFVLIRAPEVFEEEIIESKISEFFPIQTWLAQGRRILSEFPDESEQVQTERFLGFVFAEFTNKIMSIVQQSYPNLEIRFNQNPFSFTERTIFSRRGFISNTVQKVADIVLYLAQYGEIGPETFDGFGLNESHFLQIVQSGWAIATPYALIATPRLINLLPIENKDHLNEVLCLSSMDGSGWGNFDQLAFHLATLNRYPKLSFDYIYSSKSPDLTQDELWRPVWLVNYLPEEDWDDWDPNKFNLVPSIQREGKLYVHSVIPVQNVYGGITDLQDAVWKSAFYWIILQLIVLSDPQTGALYDPPIHLSLSNDWRDGSSARLYLQNEYIGDLGECIGPLMACFNWVWVNRSGNVSQDQQAILGVFRLFLKINIAELGSGGQVQFTDYYRQKLFESQQKAQLAYRGSKDARNKLREVIKEINR